MSAQAAPVQELRRLDQSEVDAICAKHDRLWTSKRGGEYSQQSKIKGSLSLWKDAPQLAEALGLEKPAAVDVTEPQKDDVDPAVLADIKNTEAVLGAVPEQEDADSDDPFA